MIKGLLNKKTLLDVVRHFIVFEKTRENTLEKIAAYHQYYAVNKAIISTIRVTFETAFAIKEPPSSYGLPSAANQPTGDRRAGVVWHTQGSGKSLSMDFLLVFKNIEIRNIILYNTVFFFCVNGKSS